MPSAKLELRPGFLLHLALLALLLPLPWLCAMTVAITLHELGHFLALWIMKIPISRIVLETAGVRICTAPVCCAQELICALAGPFFGLLTMVFSTAVPRLAICALVQTAFNLLPILPFDGGRITRSLFCLMFGRERGERIFGFLQILSGMALALILIRLLRYGVFLCLVIGLFVLRTLRAEWNDPGDFRYHHNFALAKSRRKEYNTGNTEK